MKVHQSSFMELAQSGTIWFAVVVAKEEHRKMMHYRGKGMENEAMTFKASRDGMMRSVRLIARGSLMEIARCMKVENFKQQRKEWDWGWL